MRMALILGLCLLASAALGAPRVKTDAKPPSGPNPAETAREASRSRANENVVTIMAGSPNGTELRVADELAQLLDDGDDLRVIPMVGRGAAQSVKDVMFLRGVDMGITQANILKHFARTGELGSDLVNQIAYVTKLFNEEIHILARSDIADIRQLEGQVVNLGAEGSGAEITGRLILTALGINVEAAQLGDADAIAKLKSGEIAAAILMGGKPAAVLANLKANDGLKLLPIPYTEALENDYYPATLSHGDYPELIAEGAAVDTVAVCAVLIAFNWTGDNDRSRKVVKFVDSFFSKFDAFRQPPRHPKWREVNFAATLEGWKRFPAAQAWIDRAKTKNETAAKSSFDKFLADTKPAGGVPVSEGDRAELFRAFLAWKKAKAAD
jgi:uncharacterized protein